jgi:hypothetical protein
LKEPPMTNVMHSVGEMQQNRVKAWRTQAETHWWGEVSAISRFRLVRDFFFNFNKNNVKNVKFSWNLKTLASYILIYTCNNNKLFFKILMKTDLKIIINPNLNPLNCKPRFQM